MAKDGRGLFPLYLALGCALLITGCSPGGAPSMPNWARTEQPYIPQEPSTNAFDHYAVAAREVESGLDPELLNRVHFDVDFRDKALPKLEKPLQEVIAATSKKCDFRYTTTPVFTPPPYQRGWRLIGRAFRWKIEEACSRSAYDQAIEYAVAATKFGFDLTGGGATDASLGFDIADEARKAIAPHIGKFGAGQLGLLSEGLQRALGNRPSLIVAIDHEHTRMLQGVQYVQDMYAAEQWTELLKKMKESVRDAVQYLREVKAEDSKKRPAYFEGFAKEADEETRWLKSVADMPARQREGEPGPVLAKERPWRAFAKHFFETAEPLLRIQDNTVARTRLAILNCELLKQVKVTGTAPKDLSVFPKTISLDPYTGRQFAYRGGGSGYNVYSVGSDGIDNLGDTDESYSTPDLRLEKK